MEVLLFSQRLRGLLAGYPEEGMLPDGAKLQIRSLQKEVEFFNSFLRNLQIIYPLAGLLFLFPDRLILKIKRDIITVIRESENAIDTFFVNSENVSSSEELCGALQGLERKITDIKEQLQAHQTIFNFTSIQAQVCNSSSSSGAVQRREKPRMVGREDDLKRLLDLLIEGQPPLSTITIVGEPGLGRSTLAAQVYDNIYVKNYFDSRAWVTGSYCCSFSQLLEGILKSLIPSSGLREIMAKDDKLKKTTLHDYLKNKRYLIVIIDLLDGKPLHDLRSVLPDEENRSRILTTSIVHDISRDWSLPFRLGALSDTESLEIFRHESSQIELETIKKYLHAICHGWPNAITLLRGLLSGKNMQDAFWILENLPKRSEGSLPISPTRIISYSYAYLPDYLKPCLLYFIVFPKLYYISTRQLYQLWIAEGFIEENSETTAEKYLEELTMRGFIQVTSRSSRGRIKTCRLHGVFAPLVGGQAEEEMFSSKRRSIRSHPTQNLSSLLHFFPSADENFTTHCNYVLENSKLLKVLDLGTPAVNQFPAAISNLVLLRYLKLNIPSLTSVPPLLFNLWNLYTLDMPSTHMGEAPLEIWKMHKLRHLNFAFIKLPAHPGKYCESLENLNFISTLCPSSCSEDILARLPNLQFLRIYGDLSSHQWLLSKSLAKLLSLEYLKMVNEIERSKTIVLREYQFPPTLTHLSLSNTELKDDPMPVLEQLPNLEVLKLKRNSYKGRKLACSSGGFPRLRVLHLKSLLWLEEWIMGSGAMRKIECLVINPCAYLKRLPEELWQIKTFNQMELWWPRPELKPKLREFEDMEERYDIQIYPSGL